MNTGTLYAVGANNFFVGDFMKELIISFFQDYGVALQTISSIFLLVVTIIYVIATYKVIHSSHKSFLRPLKINDEKNELIVKNFGPGVAINIKLFINTKIFKKIDPNIDPTGIIFEIFKDRYKLIECETFELEPGQNINFIYDKEVIRFDKLLLYWETITGERMLIRYNINLSPDGRIDIVRYKKLRLKSLKNTLLTPLHFISFILVGGMMRPTFEEYLEEERKKKEKKNKKWLI
ncbi:hypothetical protein [Paenibacillus amylolyticus]|nr:hypothetical protein [Paenibacillus amylolyticus]